MKYQQKIKLAEEGVVWLSEGKSIEDFQNELLGRNYYQYDIDKVLPSLKKLVSEKYGEAFRTYLLDGTLENRRLEFSNLNDEVFDLIKDYQIKTIKEQSKQEMIKLVKEGVEEEEIIARTANRFFPEIELVKEMEFYTRHNVKVLSLIHI